MSHKAHASKWERLRASIAAGDRSAVSDPRALETITQEITEMDTDIGQMAAVLKSHNDSLVQSGEKQLELNARLLELEQKAVAGGFSASKASSGHKENPVAAELIERNAFAAVKQGMPTSGRLGVEQGLRAAISNPGRGQEGANEWSSEPQRLPGIQGIAPVRLTLLDVLPVQPVTGATLEYVAIDGYVNGADYQVKEGDEKAEADLPSVMQRAEIATIAHWIPASLQVLDDNSGLQAQISQVLGTSLRQKLEHEVLVGEGGEGKILGLVPRALPGFTSVSTNPADRVGEAVTDLESNGWSASVIILNPHDWFAIASERAEEGNGQYVLGSPRDPAPPSLWGRPVVLSPSMTRNAALVLDTSQTVLLDRQQVTIETSRMDGNNFRRNLVTILAELRAGLAVYAPSAMRLVQLAA